MTDFTVIPALVAIVYTIIDITKTALGGDEKFKRFIPLIACVLGGICGVVAFYFVPGTMGTENLLVTKKSRWLPDWLASASRKMPPRSNPKTSTQRNTIGSSNGTKKLLLD